ncbi:hypothetical protein JCM19237_5397 [Photobacterium aphoticum]|uniref:Uncharacterized protein n=1 Tax=Photobacterium aphoticum TaxID=754436 RepID=A0A090QL36_9GAMM|nr:hypothetical protein JCM19237_5397 [Photobacterium aphoticum]
MWMTSINWQNALVSQAPAVSKTVCQLALLSLSITTFGMSMSAYQTYHQHVSVEFIPCQ